MSQIVSSLNRRIADLNAECDRLAEGIDKMAETQAVILNRLGVFDPSFVRQITGQPEPAPPPQLEAPAQLEDKTGMQIDADTLQ
jgi:hypothetical protein